jgi:hypothetical protein
LEERRTREIGGLYQGVRRQYLTMLKQNKALSSGTLSK